MKTYLKKKKEDNIHIHPKSPEYKYITEIRKKKKIKTIIVKRIIRRKKEKKEQPIIKLPSEEEVEKTEEELRKERVRRMLELQAKGGFGKGAGMLADLMGGKQEDREDEEQPEDESVSTSSTSSDEDLSLLDEATRKFKEAQKVAKMIKAKMAKSKLKPPVKDIESEYEDVEVEVETEVEVDTDEEVLVQAPKEPKIPLDLERAREDLLRQKEAEREVQQHILNDKFINAWWDPQLPTYWPSRVPSNILKIPVTCTEYATLQITHPRNYPAKKVKLELRGSYFLWYISKEKETIAAKIWRQFGHSKENIREVSDDMLHVEGCVCVDQDFQFRVDVNEKDKISVMYITGNMMQEWLTKINKSIKKTDSQFDVKKPARLFSRISDFIIHIQVTRKLYIHDDKNEKKR